jgi:hypothetical protein
MPGLLRGIARTAMVAGTATAVSNRVSRRQAGRWSAHQQPAAQQPAEQYQYQQPPPPPPAAAPVDPMTAKLEQLKQLGELKAQGLVTEQEFAAQKARILGT